MDLYEDSKYDVVVSQYPFNVYPGQRIFLKVDVNPLSLSINIQILQTDLYIFP